MDQTNENFEAQSFSKDVEASIAFFDFDEQFQPTVESISKLEVGRAFYQLGKLHYDKADLDKAERYFNRSLSCSDLPKDSFSVLKILGFLIRISSEKLENNTAEIHIAKADSIINDLAVNLGSLNAEYFYNAGVVQNYKGNFEAAKENFELAYKRSKEENEAELLAKCLLSLATNSYNRKEYDEALNYNSQLNQLLKIVNKSYLCGAMYMFSARIYSDMDQFDSAVKFFTLANETLQSKKCWNLFGYILLGQGIVKKKMGDFDSAITFFKLAQQAVDKTVFRRLSGLIQNEIQDVNDSSVDLYLDRTNRKVKERSMGTIDFKHRFVLLEILFLLAKNSGEYYDKEELAKSIWKDEYNPLIHDKLIYTSVSRLRKLIEPKNSKGEKRKYIVRGKDGYTFNPLAKIRFHLEAKSDQEVVIGNVDISSPV